MTEIPRLVIAAPSSGHGKTAVSVGLLAAFAGRGLTVAGFKIGPDYVDSGYLGLASGQPGRNLDPRLQGVDRVAPLFAHGAAGSDIAVVEGTMGLYDDLSGGGEGTSTAQVAGLLKAPVVLVVDVAAMGQSVGALVHGFRSFDELLWLGGAVLTGVISDRHEQILRESLGDLGVPVLGALRRRALTPLPNRQLGVAPVVDRSTDAVRAVRRLGSVVASCVDLERLLALARSAPDLVTDVWSPLDAFAAASANPPTRQLRTVSDASRVAPVSPAGPGGSGGSGAPSGPSGPGPAAPASAAPASSAPSPVSSAPAPASAPPADASGEASPDEAGDSDADKTKAVSVPPPAERAGQRAAERQSQPAAGRPVVAVAGGPAFSYSYPETIELLDAAGAEVVAFDPLRDEALPPGARGLVFGGAFPELYADELSANEPLCREVAELAFRGAPVIAESAGLLWLVKEFDGRPMCGVLNASAQTTNGQVLGYRSAIARASSPLAPLGATVVGHKAHRTLVTPRSGENSAWQWRGGQPEGFVWRKVHASYLNLHWAGYPTIAKRFVSALG
ncbi:MAG: cobyrinate a,c-diamide synthase [Micromonosporaceae bacterium]|nr:cobyrinate a,c-diamide synthase [Micromonosporaceae bacterium]